jgi:hypothetical protein
LHGAPEGEHSVKMMQSKFSPGSRRRLPALAAVVAMAGAVAAAAPAAGAIAGTTGPVTAHAAAASADITFQATNLGSQDQLVVTFPEATAPALSHSDSSAPPIWAGSGKPVSMPGNHFIYLTGNGTNYPLSGANPVTYSLPNLKSAVLYDNFEGYIGIALGLDHAASYTVSESGAQVTVDIAH